MPRSPKGQKRPADVTATPSRSCASPPARQEDFPAALRKGARRGAKRKTTKGDHGEGCTQEMV